MDKNIINSRFVECVNYLINSKIARNKIEIAENFEIGASKLSEILNGRMKAGTDLIACLCLKYGISPDWLLTGRGSMLNDQASGAPFVSAPEHETPPVQINLPANADDGFVRIPIVDVSVAAGDGYYNPHYIEEVECISMPRALIKDGCIYLCVRTKGHSMTPSILDGGYLVVRLMDRCEWGDIRDNYVYVVSDRDGKAYVKRLKNRLRQHGFIVCMSDNADKQNYPNFNIYNDELNTVWFAEWYFTAKIPNIQETFYRKQSEFEDRLDELEAQYERLVKAIELKDRS